MWSDLIIAVRNLLRNRRRTLTTTLAVAIGVIAVVIFGGFATAISLGLESSIARKEGHLHIYPQGYLEYGAANPADYAIPDPDRLISEILEDDEIQSHVVAAVPVMKLNGIAGNYREEASKTFMGVGIRPDDMKRLAEWDGYGIGGSVQVWNMTNTDINSAVVGIGMARMLNLCDELNLDECRDRTTPETEGREDQAIKRLMENLTPVSSEDDTRPDLDLLAATGRGAPNVVSVKVNEGLRQAVTALDDMYVGLHLRQAQNLVYAGEDKATAIILQLKSLDDADHVKALLQPILKQFPSNLEVRTLEEFDPTFLKILGMFNGVFVFVALVIAIVVLFTVANTMTMSVVERTSEVGTLRALGVRCSGIRRQFIVEGVLIGAVGANLGLILGLILSVAINHSDLSWTPPSSPTPMPLVLLPLENPPLLFALWLIMVVITILSSLAPASRAARQPIVNAIHHV